MEPRRRFRFLKELSEGAFGKVYMAEMITGEGFSSIVAIKLLHSKWSGHQEIAQRSRDEARLLGLLHHRNIVRVEDLTVISGHTAVVMEYLDGVDLKAIASYCKEHGLKFPKRAAFEITAQVAGALEAAYTMTPLKGGGPLQVIHRDIKPSNVMVTVAGDVKVLDFGTARANFEEREAKTQALAFGSQAYMAPERLLGDPDAPAGDIFSLGVTLFELLTFQPFGKIYIRPERYNPALEERLDQIDLSDVSEEVQGQVRDGIKSLLLYDPASRPSASGVVELMDGMADLVNDGSLQRVCRQIVRPCRDAAQPEPNPDDPLTGSTLFEDAASGPRLHADAVAEDLPPEGDGTAGPDAAPPAPLASEPRSATQSAPPEARTWSPPAPPASPTLPPTPAQPVAAPPASAWSPPSSRAAPTLPPTPVQSPTLPPRPTQPPTPVAAPPIAAPPVAAPPVAAPPVAAPPVATAPSNTPKPTGSGARGAILAAVVVAGLLVAAGLGVALVIGGKTDDPAPTPPTPQTTEQTPASPKAAPGGRVEVGPMDGSRGTVKLTLAKPALVNITSATGFKQDWDGTGTLELVGLPAGTYRTKISGASGDSVRSTLDVAAGQTCAFGYDAGKGDSWEAKGCE